MRNRLFDGMWFLLAALATSSAMATSEKPDPSEYRYLHEEAVSYFQPLPSPEANLAKINATPEMVELGHTLFFDPRLSRGGTVMCNSCHNLAAYGVDNLPTSPGWKSKFGNRNSPTVLNSSVFLAQFWDGRAKDVEEQAGGPILNPIEMALPNEAAAEKIIRSIPGYKPLFDKTFGHENQNSKDAETITFKNIRRAIGAFERTLLTPSRFDAYLKGDLTALTPREKQGMRKFIDIGCVACHYGVGMGGGQYHRFGLSRGPYWKFTGAKKPDFGRFEVTKNEEDKFLFKVPGLRNVEKTYPYLHDGSVWELEKVVGIMIEAQLGNKLPKRDVDDVVTFLKSLTGEIPKDAMRIPQLPSSGKDTPKPDNR